MVRREEKLTTVSVVLAIHLGFELIEGCLASIELSVSSWTPAVNQAWPDLVENCDRPVTFILISDNAIFNVGESKRRVVISASSGKKAVIMIYKHCGFDVELSVRLGVETSNICKSSDQLKTGFTSQLEPILTVTYGLLPCLESVGACRNLISPCEDTEA